MANIESSLTWRVASLQESILSNFYHLQSLVSSAMNGRVDIEALSKLMNMSDLSSIESSQTVLKKITRIDANTINIVFDAKMRSPDTHIY